MKKSMLYGICGLGIVLAIGLLVFSPSFYRQLPPDARADLSWDGFADGFVDEMAGFQVLTPPISTEGLEFLDKDGQSLELSAFRGRVVLINFWATWCAPCLAEMPSLNRLQIALGGKDFQIITIATGRNASTDIDSFFTNQNITHLTRYRDPNLRLALALGAGSLPTTVLMDRDGSIIARLQGEADWDSEAARLLIERLVINH
ncbi:MAG: TlpA family protein disulfide reductase [Proteobacteria bacterium]|nr:TlpA family protein disulfide reductase [Pseudomonadota bacterium]